MKTTTISIISLEKQKENDISLLAPIPKQHPENNLIRTHISYIIYAYVKVSQIDP
jgi:hypothetical protein